MQRDLDAARKLLEGQRADLEAATTRVHAGQVISPATGVIAARRGEVGAPVNPSIEDLFVIATDLSRLNLVIEPDPAQLQRIQPGQSAYVVVADVPESLPGVVKDVDKGTVTVEFSNPSPAVRPGMTAQVRIKTG
jgi:multidrug resistance efflux pump